VFPPPSGGPTYNYTEVFVGASFDTVTSRLYYTNSYFGGGKAGYLEVNASRALTDHISVLGHLGYLALEGPREPHEGGQQLGIVDFLVGLSVDVSGYSFALSIVGTNAQGESCPAGSQRCTTTAVVSVSHAF
jgi:hypothetical protein